MGAAVSGRPDLALPSHLYAEPEDYRRPQSAWCVRDEAGRKVVPYLSMDDARAMVLGRRALDVLCRLMRAVDEDDVVRQALALETDEARDVLESYLSPPPPFCSYCGNEISPTDATIAYAEGDVMHQHCQDRWDEASDAKDRT